MFTVRVGNFLDFGKRKRRPLLAHASLAWNCRERLQGNGDANSCSNSGVNTLLQGNGDAVPAAVTRTPTRAAIPASTRVSKETETRCQQQ
ncbi:hypothetical protein NDU88_004803 [Pleurodeles waltl]|uniref:Uncharacterized protein n=1 Tax=Pleurodeles waltl TaxID=8319 RepID=A0AAV7LJ84_PLEWA|nr:hypothetical protein NDU88_004803 [Pleurodeles waltl]